MSDKPYIYFDYAAATPIDAEVLQSMEPYFSETFFNPSALYTGARDAKQALQEARVRVSKILGAKPSEITFVSGGTESANLAITGVMSSFPDATMITSAIEHDAVLEPAKRTGRVRTVSVDTSGRVNVHDVIDLIDDSTVLISIMYVNNEVGTVQPIKELCDAVSVVRKNRQRKGIRTPLWVHTDACQAPQYLDITVGSLGVDLMTLNGGKIFGPKQSGVLYHKTGVTLQPQILGGGQELGLRSGTENVAYCVGFSVALERATTLRGKVTRNVAEVAQYFRQSLEADIPDCVFNGHKKLRVPSTVHVTFSGKDNERILFALDDAGIYAASGSACSASNEESSHVLKAMGLSDAEARASIRFTIGKYTTKEEIDRAVKILKKAVNA